MIVSTLILATFYGRTADGRVLRVWMQPHTCFLETKLLVETGAFEQVFLSAPGVDPEQTWRWSAPEPVAYCADSGCYNHVAWSERPFCENHRPKRKARRTRP